MKLEKIYHWYTASGALVAELSPETNLEDLMQALAPLGGLVCFDSSSAVVAGPSRARPFQGCRLFRVVSRE